MVGPGAGVAVGENVTGIIVAGGAGITVSTEVLAELAGAGEKPVR